MAKITVTPTLEPERVVNFENDDLARAFMDGMNIAKGFIKRGNDFKVSMGEEFEEEEGVKPL